MYSNNPAIQNHPELIALKAQLESLNAQYAKQKEDEAKKQAELLRMQEECRIQKEKNEILSEKYQSLKNNIADFDEKIEEKKNKIKVIDQANSFLTDLMDGFKQYKANITDKPLTDNTLTSTGMTFSELIDLAGNGEVDNHTQNHP
jgi:chromosome segregation ATPase